MSDIDPEPLKDVVDGIRASNHEEIGVAGDVTNPEFPSLLIKSVLVFSQVSIDGRGQNRLRLRAGFFFAALNPPVGAGGSDPSSQP